MRRHLHRLMLAAAFLLTAAVYWPGLSGGYLFDDYPNIVDNAGVQPHDAKVSTLVGAALSSPSSEFKRPLASLSFAMNYLATGLDPYWMKLTNLVIHLLNGLLVFVLSRSLLRSAMPSDASSNARRQPLEEDAQSATNRSATDARASTQGGSDAQVDTRATVDDRTGVVAALIAAGWLLMPINLTGVLYVVQRMESMANLFVLLGLIGYVAGRRLMLTVPAAPTACFRAWPRGAPASRAFWLCFLSVIVPTAVGLMAKETAVMLPLYALLVEWALFRFQPPHHLALATAGEQPTPRRDYRVIGLFVVVLALPLVVGLAWLLPGILKPQAWATRDFTLTTRLLTEARIVVDYIAWTLLPTPGALSFYHDDFSISTGLLTPWTTLASMVVLAALVALAWWLRRRRPLAALGIALFLGCQLLTSTILPLELIYEHRNYFASFGLLLVAVPLLAVPRSASFALPRQVLLGAAFLCWTALTATTAYAWGNPLRLAEELAFRAPESPRAQYELGRTYIIYSNYDPGSPFTALAYAPLERAASLPGSSILPEQALIFMNARMHLPLKDVWWDSLTEKLKARRPGVQDESSLGALTQCAHERRCDLPTDCMIQAFLAALSHPNPSARLLATYGDYAWNVLDDRPLGLRMTREAVTTSPREAAYRITQIRMLAAQGRKQEARTALQGLEALNIGGHLDRTLDELHALLASP